MKRIVEAIRSTMRDADGANTPLISDSAIEDTLGLALDGYLRREQFLELENKFVDASGIPSLLTMTLLTLAAHKVCDALEGKYKNQKSWKTCKMSAEEKEELINRFFPPMERPEDVELSFNCLLATFSNDCRRSEVQIPYHIWSVVGLNCNDYREPFIFMLATLSTYWLGDETMYDFGAYSFLASYSMNDPKKGNKLTEDFAKKGELDTWRDYCKEHNLPLLSSVLETKDGLEWFYSFLKLDSATYFPTSDCNNIVEGIKGGKADDQFIERLMRTKEYMLVEDFNNRVSQCIKDYRGLNNIEEFCMPIKTLVGPVKNTKSTPKKKKKKTTSSKKKKKKKFELLGRTELNAFFNDSIIDVIENSDVYSKFGIGFPEPFILEGPPGCGKTYAVARLEEYLDIPTYHITSSAVGSSFVHETAKKIESTFEEASNNDRSMVIVDEMESFMPDRSKVERADSHYIEEVNAFLKCLQTAQENNILVVGMTNYIDRIDPAILRSGRMGTHLKVSWPSVEEITQVLKGDLKNRPYDKDIDLAIYAPRFLERPLSDVSAVVRRAAMSAARKRAERIEREDLETAMDFVLGANKKEERRIIGFCA